MDRQTFFRCVADGTIIKKADYRARTSLELCQFNAMAKADEYYTKEELWAMPDFDKFWYQWWNDAVVPRGFPEITVDEFQDILYRQHVEYMLKHFF